MGIDRQLEPEVMDTPADAMAYDAMDHGEVNRRFIDDFVAGQPPHGEILDLGTGTARIPIELCRRDERYRVVAVDMSISMLEIARINLEIAGVVDQVLLGHADAKRLPYSSGRFAAVISNSLLHHLPEPAAALSEAVRVIQPTGTLFFRDLLRPASAAAIADLVERYTAHESNDAQQLFADSLHAALNLAEIRQLVDDLGFPTSSVQVTSDRHWTWQIQLTANRS